MWGLFGFWGLVSEQSQGMWDCIPSCKCRLKGYLFFFLTGKPLSVQNAKTFDTWVALKSVKSSIICKSGKGNKFFTFSQQVQVE